MCFNDNNSLSLRFIFFGNNPESAFTLPRIKTSAKAAALFYLSPTSIGIYSYDFYDPLAFDGDEGNDLEAMRLRFVYSLDKPIRRIDQIFTDQGLFMKH